MMSPDFYVVNDPKGLATLKYWLQRRKYNTFVEILDAHGKPGFGLLWDYSLGVFPSPKRGKRGIIVVTDKALRHDTALVILNHTTQECEYGKQWVQGQRNLYQYGKA